MATSLCALWSSSSAALEDTVLYSAVLQHWRIQFKQCCSVVLEDTIYTVQHWRIQYNTVLFYSTRGYSLIQCGSSALEDTV